MDFINSNFSFNRSIMSYAKVQHLYSKLIRNRRFQLKKLKKNHKRYLNVGCGPSVNNHFVNLDYYWMPHIDLCWDISKGIPLERESMRGIYTEHCLEHVSFSTCQNVLKEFYKALEKGGWVRIVVPDAEIYMDSYAAYKKNGVAEFPYVTNEEINRGYTPMMAINRVFRNHGHMFAYDFDTLRLILQQKGFINIEKKHYMNGEDVKLLVDSEDRKIESLYIEAQKPKE